MSPALQPVPRLHVVTDDEVLARVDFRRQALAVLAEGGPDLALHVRGPHSTGASVYRIVRDLKGAADEAEALLLVNDRVDVALACGLGGAHLGGRSLDPDLVRGLLGPEAILGRSAHDAEEVAASVRSGVSFVVVGNVFETPSHPGRAGLGPSGLGAAVEAAGAIPVIAIGGVSPERTVEVLDAGAHGVAVLRGVWASHAPGEAVRDYISRLGRQG